MNRLKRALCLVLVLLLTLGILPQVSAAPAEPTLPPGQTETVPVPEPAEVPLQPLPEPEETGPWLAEYAGLPWGRDPVAEELAQNQSGPHAGIAPMAAAAFPDRMLNNEPLDALEHLGYPVSEHRSRGVLFDYGSISFQGPAGGYTAIPYGSGCYGTEKRPDASTASGFTPDVPQFESGGLVCASYVGYFWLNYVPNILGHDTSAIDRAVKDKRWVPSWRAGLESLAGRGWITQPSGCQIKVDKSTNATWSSIPGDIVFFGDAHMALYAGYGYYAWGDSNTYFFTHVGNDRGPEITTSKELGEYGKGDSGPLYPDAWFHISLKAPQEDVSGTARIEKQNPDGDVEGYCFKLYQYEKNKSWYGRTDASGQLFETDSSYRTKTGGYEFTGLTDGTYTMKEALSVKGAGNVFPDSWKIQVIDAKGNVTYEKTYGPDRVQREPGGDARPSEPKISLTGLTGGGVLRMTVRNRPVLSTVRIVKKTSTGLNLSGWKIGLYTDPACQNPVKGTPFLTGPEGIADIPDLVPGTYYAKELGGVDADPYWKCDSSVQTVEALPGKTASVTFRNEHLGKLRIRKQTEGPGPLKGWCFEVTDSGGKPVEGSPFTTDDTGIIASDLLKPGSYTVKERLPVDSPWICRSPNPQTVTITPGQEAEVTFTNALRSGRISVLKTEPNQNVLAGAVFRLDWSRDGTVWKPVTPQKDGEIQFGTCASPGLTDGCLVTGKNGLCVWEGLHPDALYRVTEVQAPKGFQLLTEPVFQGKLPGKNLTAELCVINQPVFTLPHTGSGDLRTVQAGLLLCAAMLPALIPELRKKV